LAELLRSVGRLALPAADQVEYLRRLGTWPLVDELALELDETLGAVSDFVAAGWITASEHEILKALDGLLEAMSGDDHADQWTPEALETSVEWQKVRALARSFFSTPS
jgi:hypothetical protein